MKLFKVFYKSGSLFVVAKDLHQAWNAATSIIYWNQLHGIIQLGSYD